MEIAAECSRRPVRDSRSPGQFYPLTRAHQVNLQLEGFDNYGRKMVVV